MIFDLKQPNIDFSSIKLIINVIFNREKRYTQVNRSAIGLMQRKIVVNSSQDLIQCFNVPILSEHDTTIELINLLPKKTKQILETDGNE